MGEYDIKEFDLVFLSELFFDKEVSFNTAEVLGVQDMQAYPEENDLHLILDYVFKVDHQVYSIQIFREMLSGDNTFNRMLEAGYSTVECYIMEQDTTQYTRRIK